MNSTVLTELIVWYAVFLFSTTLHEAAHSFVSGWFGDDTAYRAGSASLNPIPHMQREKMGMIVVPLASFFFNVYSGRGAWMFGWASAPFNPYWAARYPKRSFGMALAGPLTHLIPASLAWAGMYIGLRTGFFGPATPEMYPVSGSGGALPWALAMIANVVFQLNTILCVFNLMPFPPLDGSEVWYLFMKREEDRLRWRYQANSYAFAGLMLSWYFFPDIYGPIFVFLLRTLYSF